MSTETTLLNVRDNVRLLLRDTDSDNPTHSNNYLNLLINQELRSMHNYLKNADESYLLTFTTYVAQTDAVSGTDNERYTLPTTFGSFVGAVWLGDNARDPIIPMQKSAIGGRNTVTGKPIWIYFKGNEFGLIPAPDAKKTIELWNIPKYVNLSADGDLLTIPDDYINVPELHAALMALKFKNAEIGLISVTEKSYKESRDQFQQYAARRGFIVKKREAFGTGYGSNRAILR